MIDAKTSEEILRKKIQNVKLDIAHLNAETRRQRRVIRNAESRIRIVGTSRVRVNTLEAFRNRLGYLEQVKYNLQTEMHALSATFCKMREVRRGRSKKNPAIILATHILSGAWN